MKTIKLLQLAFLCMAITLVSCSGEDGAQGERGPQGIQGDSGDDGADGLDGIACWDRNGNGSADIDQGGSKDDEDINDDGVVDALDCQGDAGSDGVNGYDGEDGNANVEEHIFGLDLFGNYTELNLDLLPLIEEPQNYAYLFYIEHNQSGYRYSIPGNLFNNTHYALVYTDLPNGDLIIKFYGLDDNPIAIPPNEYRRVVVVAIELNNSSKGGDYLRAQLKAVGVDANNYLEVAAYFGLNK